MYNFSVFTESFLADERYVDEAAFVSVHVLERKGVACMLTMEQLHIMLSDCDRGGNVNDRVLRLSVDKSHESCWYIRLDNHVWGSWISADFDRIYFVGLSNLCMTLESPS